MEALQNKRYQLKWVSCADIPSKMYDASVAVDGNFVFVTAGGTPEDETKNNVYQYNITADEWSTLPPPGHRFEVLCMLGNDLTIFGSSRSVTCTHLNKVSTYHKNSNSWSQAYPDMTHARFKPSVVVHENHVIVMGGLNEFGNYHNGIEVMNWQHN